MDVDCGTSICHVAEIFVEDPCVIYFGNDCNWPCSTTGCKNDTEVDMYCPILKSCDKKPVPPASGNNANVAVIITSIIGAFLLVCGISFVIRFFIRKCSNQYEPILPNDSGTPTQNDSGTPTQNDSGSGSRSIENYNFSLYDSDDDSPIIRRPVARGGLGGLQPPQFLTDQLTLSQPGGADYAHHSTTSPPGFSDGPEFT